MSTTRTHKEEFREKLLTYFDTFSKSLATNTGEWVVKGFIDVYRNIYTISIDTKVVSKIVELILFPIISRFAQINNYRLVLSEHQNHYPDISLVLSDNTKIALDLKSTYRVSKRSVSGFTLGAFTGYFRKRTSTKNITFPYSDYAAHFVLGVIYSRNEDVSDERDVYTLDDLQDIVSVIQDFTFLLNEKWEIANDHPGSGNTKNIGSTKNIEKLINGKGTFAAYGEEVFDDYWMNYLTKDMAKSIDSDIPYRNLEEYWQWRQRAPKR
ncbi:MAG: type II restriction endonuclease [Chloroflexota bacterium]|nr:type II restriction endonuclease [Chloroflexota bacterium]